MLYYFFLSGWNNTDRILFLLSTYTSLWRKNQKVGLNPSLSVNMFVCLFVVFRPTREIFSHMVTSHLPVKGCKFWPMLGTHGHWVLRVLKRATPLWHRASVYEGYLWGSLTLTPIVEHLGVELSLTVFCELVLSRLGF